MRSFIFSYHIKCALFFSNLNFYLVILGLLQHLLQLIKVIDSLLIFEKLQKVNSNTISNSFNTMNKYFV